MTAILAYLVPFHQISSIRADTLFALRPSTHGGLVCMSVDIQQRRTLECDTGSHAYLTGFTAAWSG